MATATTTQKPNPPSTEDKGESKFDLSKVKVDELPEEIRDQVKGLQADYTKKTQALADEKKANADKISRGEQWDNWYDRNKDTLADYNSYAQKIAKGENVHTDNRNPDPTVEEDDDDLDTGDANVKKDINRLESTYQQGKKELESTIQGNTDVLIDLMEEIQVGEYPFKINPKKVIEFARSENVSDVKKAIQGAYKDELIDAEVNKRVEEKLAVEREKDIKVVNGGLPQGRVVRKVIKRGDTKKQ